MTLDLTQFHEIFFEESFEALDSMEAALLKLSAGEVDAELINTIFRVAHSIKGGAATFAFNEVAGFTHVLETLLDQLRAGKRQVRPDIVDVLLRSGDAMRGMLSATQRKDAIDTAGVAKLRAELDRIMGESGTAAAPVAAASPAKTHAAPDAPAPTPGWRIRFVPGPDLLRHGNDPLRILRELSTLGHLKVSVDAGGIPPLTDLDPEVCRLRWNLEVEGEIERSAVHAVFEWAESECELTIERIGGEPSAPAVAAPSESAAPVAAAAAAPEAVPPKAEVAARNANPDGGSIRVSIEKIDELLNSVGELVITQSVLSQLAAPLEGREAGELRSALAQLERHMRALQESVMRVRMLPISFVFNRFPRLVRDLGQRLGKKIELKVTGDTTELDKTVLEKIGDPLVHLVRNSIDHGIEMPDVRLAAGKSEHGTISLHAYHKGGNVIVEVSDDGGGLRKDKILRKALERGLVTNDVELSEERILNLIFAPGFSTADVVSDVSGRGVGMDVVRRNINELGGHIQIFSTEGKGSTIRIRLPLTLAILDGQLARVGKEVYVVPIVSIVETIQVTRERVCAVASGGQVFRLRDDYLPIVRLHALFDIEPDHHDLLDGLLMIVEADGKRVGLFVDELMSQQQVVIKSLETNFKQVTGLAGATMLGDGRVALILDIPGVITRFQAPEERGVAKPQAA
ncbi:MAG TPA: chemotaxis protein CheA [Steroidobacteraceae bacterium]|nr:chemotaxis protein CheA [Steroidobacteraceae bacterium]